MQSPEQSGLVEIIQLLTSWKSEQDEKMSEVMHEIQKLKEEHKKSHKTVLRIKDTMDTVIKNNDEIKEQIEGLQIDNKINIDTLERKIQELEMNSSMDIIAFGGNSDRSLSGNPNVNRTSASKINYGVGMACNFFEGYLTQILPCDGGDLIGFQDNIMKFQADERVAFPVKRLFIVITKSLYCPPDLKHFNKENRKDLPYLEAVRSLKDVEKDVAGVKNRNYRNSAYKICRPDGKRPVYITAEFPTPLHTLHKVLEKRAIYEKLCDVDVEQIVKDFCEQLRKIVARSPDCRGKCELVHYDDKNDDENLADVLLNKIREIQPDFEEIIESESRDLRLD